MITASTDTLSTHNAKQARRTRSKGHSARNCMQRHTCSHLAYRHVSHAQTSRLHCLQSYMYSRPMQADTSPAASDGRGVDDHGGAGPSLLRAHGVHRQARRQPPKLLPCSSGWHEHILRTHAHHVVIKVSSRLVSWGGRGGLLRRGQHALLLGKLGEVMSPLLLLLDLGLSGGGRRLGGCPGTRGCCHSPFLGG